MTSVASMSRSSVSHHGVRAGVSSFGLMSNSSRVGGNSTRRGRGGMSRSSHHSTGRLSRPEQHQRLREAERQAHHAGPPERHAVRPAVGDGGVVALADARMQRQQQLVRRAVGAVDGEAPAELGGLGADFVAVAREPRLVVGAPVLGAAGGDLAGAFRLDELDAAGIGEGLFRRIDDLDQMALRAVAGKLRQRSRGSPRSGSTGRTARRSPTARPAQSRSAGSRARSDRG